MDKNVENVKESAPAKSEDNSLDLVSLCKDFGSGVAAGARAAMAPAETAIRIGTSVGMAAAEGLSFAAGPGFVAARAATDIVTAGAARAVGRAAVDAVSNKEVQDVAKEAVIGAAVGGVIGASCGDSTRAMTMAAIGAITAGAAKVMEDCNKSKMLNPVEAAKQIGADTWNHMKQRPGEALLEGTLLGVPGVVAGAQIRKAMEQKGAETLGEKIGRKVNEAINDRDGLIKELMKTPFMPIPVLSPIPTFPEALKNLSTVPNVDVIKAGASAGKNAVDAMLSEHRKENPTSSMYERAAGQVIGGYFGGKAVGTAIEMGHIGANKTYDYIKSWFK